MSIKVEANITKDPYTFDMDQNGYPIFTRKNLALLHALLRYDSNYSASEDEQNETTYAGLLAKNGVPTNEADIREIVTSINKVNSTHLAAEDGGIENAVNKIASIDKPKGRLAERLKNRDDELVKRLLTQARGTISHSQRNSVPMPACSQRIFEATTTASTTTCSQTSCPTMHISTPLKV
ncbi:MAG: hypothetical protein SO366_07790 [Atopobiaceae bacterium]|nr:hypothetical protein [Atopobiaceae bacterium]